MNTSGSNIAIYGAIAANILIAISKTEQLLKLLKKNPELGQFDKKWQAHKFLIVS